MHAPPQLKIAAPQPVVSQKTDLAHQNEIEESHEFMNPSGITPKLSHNFTSIPMHSTNALVVQPKLAINKPGDIYEQEADAMADKVMRMTHEPSILQIPPLMDITPFKQSKSEAAAPIINQRLSNKIAALQGTGVSMDGNTKSFMSKRFGFDFSEVKIHTNLEAVQISRELNANAFTVGHDIYFNEGAYKPGSEKGKYLLGHELTHTLQQSDQAGLSIQRDIISDAQDKLSYGLFDWAITDEEALEVLALFSTIPQADLSKELSRLGSKYITRFLDNLPDAAKTGDVYKRVIETLGPSGVTSYATDLLSYGILDWRISDAEVTQVFNSFINLPDGSREQFLADLNKGGRLGRLIENSNAGHHTLYIQPWINTLTRGGITKQQIDILRIIVENSDNLETLKIATQKRFNVDVGPTKLADRTPVEWDSSHLSETYLTLDKLPEAHVANNNELRRFGQFKQKRDDKGNIVAGSYNSIKQELAINILNAKGGQDTIIHETGHSVDAALGWSRSPEPAKPERGGWKNYSSNYVTCAADMVNDSAGGIKTRLKAEQQKDVVDVMAEAMGNRSGADVEKNIKSLGWFAGLPIHDKKAVLKDRAIGAISIGLKSPWFDALDGGEHLGDHVYEESYANDWSRYRHEARSRMLTQYQFRKAGEWFAECYEAYYSPDNKIKGAKLNDKDPNTKKYFDDVVDKLANSR